MRRPHYLKMWPLAGGSPGGLPECPDNADSRAETAHLCDPAAEATWHCLGEIPGRAGLHQSGNPPGQAPRDLQGGWPGPWRRGLGSL